MPARKSCGARQDVIDALERSSIFRELFITMFNATGLTGDDYQRNDVVGFGDYEGDNADTYNTYLTAAERQKPLPFLFR